MEQYSHITTLKITHVNPQDIKKCNSIMHNMENVSTYSVTQPIEINENTFCKMESEICTLITSDRLCNIIVLFPNIEEISYDTNYGIKGENDDRIMGESYNSKDNPFANIILPTLKKLKLNSGSFEQFIDLRTTFPNLEYLYLNWTWMGEDDWKNLPVTLKTLIISECWKNPQKYIQWTDLKNLSHLTVDFTPNNMEKFKKEVPVNICIAMENDYGIMGYLEKDKHWAKNGNKMIKIKDY